MMMMCDNPLESRNKWFVDHMWTRDTRDTDPGGVIEGSICWVRYRWEVGETDTTHHQPASILLTSADIPAPTSLLSRTGPSES